MTRVILSTVGTSLLTQQIKRDDPMGHLVGHNGQGVAEMLVDFCQPTGEVSHHRFFRSPTRHNPLWAGLRGDRQRSSKG